MKGFVVLRAYFVILCEIESKPGNIALQILKQACPDFVGVQDEMGEGNHKIKPGAILETPGFLSSQPALHKGVSIQWVWLLDLLCI